MLRESGRRLPFTPKAVVSTSEMLHGYQREAIEAAFGCFVANEYGARDAGILAYECPQGGMHLTNENLILEILHPVTLEPVKPGQSGLAVVTDLNNYSMPRLRYVLGDMVSLSENERCSCGRTMPLLKSVDGRQTDMFLSKDWKLIHGSAFNSLAVSCPAVKQFRIVQKSVSTPC
jgi:phenylacetate-CoA ligase